MDKDQKILAEKICEILVKYSKEILGTDESIDQLLELVMAEVAIAKEKDRYETKKKMIKRIKDELNLDENDSKELVSSEYILEKLENLRLRIIEGQPQTSSHLDNCKCANNNLECLSCANDQHDEHCQPREGREGKK